MHFHKPRINVLIIFFLEVMEGPYVVSLLSSMIFSQVMRKQYSMDWGSHHSYQFYLFYKVHNFPYLPGEYHEFFLEAAGTDTYFVFKCSNHYKGFPIKITRYVFLSPLHS